MKTLCSSMRFRVVITLKATAFMKIPATIDFVTLQNGREEFTADGFVELKDSSVRISYVADSYSLSVEYRAGVVTVIRSGEHSYKAFFCEGRETVFETAGFSLPLFTEKLRFKAGEHRVHLSAKYSLGGKNSDATTVILHAEYYKNSEEL